ncbi:hypothetical protein [Kordiimonas aestuarii]|uniref:hypothetical protein n=1 Tax=Kordiimonas aestuarii TaxID=1005925 RepID=UPI0021CF85B0|nr:hypothetical protein [Kordiimonas aestuarii]
MKRTLLAGVLLCLAACRAPSSVLDSAALQDRLAPVPTAIPKGQCAIVLMPRAEKADPIFFQVLGRREAFIALDKKQQRLTLKRANNKLENGLWLKQELEGHRLSISLTLRPINAAQDTAPYRGVVSLTRPAGWSNAIAVKGRIECQSRN